MAEVFDVLRHDHEEVETMLATLEDTPSTRTGANAEHLAERRALVERLVMAESRHEAAEEQYFWPAVKDKVGDGAALTEKALSQEQQGKELLRRIDGMSPENVEFESLLGQFIAAAREHIRFEQQEVWPRLSAALTLRESEELAKKVERAKALGPTRPHPDTPPKAGLLKTAGLAAAMVDRVRDSVTNRGEKS